MCRRQGQLCSEKARRQTLRYSEMARPSLGMVAASRRKLSVFVFGGALLVFAHARRVAEYSRRGGISAAKIVQGDFRVLMQR